jgi:hypothetical protein
MFHAIPFGEVLIMAEVAVWLYKQQRHLQEVFLIADITVTQLVTLTFLLGLFLV